MTVRRPILVRLWNTPRSGTFLGAPPDHSRKVFVDVFSTAETSHYGNVVKGWDAFLAATDIKAIHSSRKPKVNDKDRLFTLSSPSYVTEDENGADGDDDPDYMDNADMKQRKKSLAGPGTRKYREDDMYD
jgi:hypothetical protein